MEVTYGCECTNNCDAHDPELGPSKAPCAFLIERDGITLKVCTSCVTRNDELIARLFNEHTDLKPFFEYDFTEMFHLPMLVSDVYWNSWLERRRVLKAQFPQT